MKQNVYFVSGIDTDAGKSYATGFLAREWNKNGQRTITQKFIQTGNVDVYKRQGIDRIDTTIERNTVHHIQRGTGSINRADTTKMCIRDSK